MIKVVGVIGAGAAGLCAARHIAATPGLKPILWEKADSVGGTWVYTPQVDKDEHGLPVFSSMYKNLKTNLPKEIMHFPDFPFPEQDESFITHTEVLKYLESYADHYNLHQYIQFGCLVEEVRPVEHNNEDQPTSWRVTVQNLENATTTTIHCDAILVCNGHHSEPRMPTIKDIDKFTGLKMHSHCYREPEPFRGLRVVMLGAGPSGLDISLEVADVAKEVILSHNLPLEIPSELPANVEQRRGVTAAYENGFYFGDGTEAEVDAIIYCTGYNYTFPFLSEDCGVTVEDGMVKPLYKHLINAVHPSMGFVGIPIQVVPFPLFDYQVRFFLAMLTGGVEVSSQAMQAEITQSLQHKGVRKRDYHKLGWGGMTYYVDDLVSQADMPPISPHYMTIFKIVILRLLFSFCTFKKLRYTLEGRKVKECRGRQEVNTSWELGWLMFKRLMFLMWKDFPRCFWFALRKLRQKIGAYHTPFLHLLTGGRG